MTIVLLLVLLLVYVAGARYVFCELTRGPRGWVLGELERTGT